MTVAVSTVATASPKTLSSRPPSSRPLASFLAAWFAGFQRSRTHAVYSRDLMDFAVFIGAVPKDPFQDQASQVKRRPSQANTQKTQKHPNQTLPPWNIAYATKAVELLLHGPGGPWSWKLANSIVEEYKKSLIERKAAPNTINRKLTVLRAISKAAYKDREATGISWYLTVPNLVVEPKEVPSGADRAGKAGVNKMLAYLAQLIRQRDHRAIRDYAIIRLIFDLGIRRGEVALLNSDHVVLGKVAKIGVTKRLANRMVWRALSRPTATALRLWLRIRGNKPGPLFFPMSGKGAGYMRLSETSIYRMVVDVGRRCGVRARPHNIQVVGRL